MRIESLNRDNYDTWRMHMEAILVKNDAWTYISGECSKPALIVGNMDSETAVKSWEKFDAKAKSEIILAISPSELKQVKGCTTSREVWLKLEGIYQSKGPARKATLLKQLMLQKMEEGADIRGHVNRFFDVVDKLQEMEVEINADLLAIMMLYSLPSSFENFRCAIESRDQLPTPDVLRVKIVEESEVRSKDTNASTNASDAMLVKNKKNTQWRGHGRNGKKKYGDEESDPKKKEEGHKKFSFRCHKCGKFAGHKAADCRSKNMSANSATENTCLTITQEALVSSKNSSWCLDSGATSHMCRDIAEFSEVIPTCEKLNLANDSSANIAAKGTANLALDVNGELRNTSLIDALHVPDLRTNLLSVSKITDKGFEVRFRKNDAIVIDEDGQLRLKADRIGDLYYARQKDSSKNGNRNGSKTSTCSYANDFKSWHRRLGHLNVRDMKEAIRNGTIRGLELSEIPKEQFECEICEKGKMSRTPFPKKSERKTELLEIIHSDVCGPMRTESNGKAKYFVEFIDDYSRWCVVKFLQRKSEVFEETKQFIAAVENMKDRRVKIFQSDNGTEYTSKSFTDYLKSKGISRRLTVPYNPEQNGIAERKNRTLLDMARCLLIQSELSSTFWAEAVNTANYIRNRCPTKSLNGRTPYELWTGETPDISNLKEFGSRVLFLNREPGRGKFEPKSEEGIFLGYSEESKGYRVWSQNKRKVLTVRDLKTFENHNEKLKKFDDFAPKQAISTEGNVPIIPRMVAIEENTPEEIEVEAEEPVEQGEVEHEEEQAEIEETPSEDDAATENEQVEGRKSEHKDERRGPGRPKIIRTGKPGRPRKVYNEIQNETRNIEENAFLSEIPFQQAMRSPEVDEWKKAINSEIESILKNNTWKLVERPKQEKVIGSRMVLRNKYAPDGTIARRKARLVAQGFAQRPGIQFNETFAPVCRMSSIRLLVSIAARLKMDIRQFDVKCAFLNGELEENIYMETPTCLRESLETISVESEENDLSRKAAEMLESTNGDKVCLLRKALYGLKQAGRSWNAKLDQVLREFGAKPTNSDHCFYVYGKGEKLTLIAVYVDDIIVASNNPTILKKLKNHLNSNFEIKDLGEINYCLGVEFTRSDRKICMNQRGYINELLSRFGMTEANTVGTPLDQNVRLTKQKESQIDERLPYRELVGALTYLAVTTRPDICFAVSYLGQFNHCYQKAHWSAAKRVLRYLKGTKNLGLVFDDRQGTLIGYVDADWGNCPDDRKSYTGYTFTLGGGPISWDARKQRTVALSSTEAEYMAMTEAVKEAIYLQEFLGELGMKKSTKVFGDNNGALKLAKNPVFHARTKHIDIRHHFIRDALKQNELKLEHISTKEMVADIFTKGLPKPKHEHCMKLLNMHQ